MHCPSLIVFGTYFPAWMLCAIVGVIVGGAAAPLFRALRIEPWPRLLVYPSLSLTVTFACWLVWFGH